MTTIGSETKRVPGINATVTIGSDLHALAQDYSYDEGYEEIHEPVGGTTTPIFGVGTFLGEIQIELLYSTDQSTARMTLTNGDLSTQSVIMALPDTQTSPTTKTHTASNVRFYRQGVQKQRHNIIRYKLRGLYGSPVQVT